VTAGTVDRNLDSHVRTVRLRRASPAPRHLKFGRRTETQRPGSQASPTTSNALSMQHEACAILSL
jgi:hypothetical protein